MFESQNFRDKMAGLARRFEEVSHLLGTPEVIGKRDEFTKLSREYADLEPLIQAWRTYARVLAALPELRKMAEAGDPEMRDLARDELRTRAATAPELADQIKILLLTKDPN